MKAQTKVRATAGMTLLEVLIAVSLFAILGVGIFTALRVGLSSMDHANARLMSNRRAAYAVRILESEINGLMPEFAVIPPTPMTPMQSMQFFQGEAQTMRFVSSYSIQDASRGMPQILEFTVIPGEERGVRLVVNERVYTGPASAGALYTGLAIDPLTNMRVPLFRPVVTGPTSFVLADKLASCHFFFERPPTFNLPAAWVDHWTRQDWPIAIRIEMGPLDPDPTRLQPMSVTSEVHASRIQGIDYADN
jgi:general secretion pathway protein J